jgi:transposase
LKKWVVSGKLLKGPKAFHKEEITMKETTHQTQDSTNSTLCLAFELSQKKWKLGFSVRLGQVPWRRTVEAGDLVALDRAIQLAKKRLGLSEACRVMSCYEAGRDGFWLHRYLMSQGIANVVVDSASIEVNRRAKRVKTDRLDAGKLVGMLVRYASGERKVWSVVHVPSVEAEDRRHLHRELATLKADRTRHINRIKGLLATQGVRMPVQTDFLARLDEVRLWDGSGLRPGLRGRLEQEYRCLQFVHQQILAREAERRELLRTSDEPYVGQVRQLLRLYGIGENSAWSFVVELFGWREFRNRRQIGGLLGLAPTPYQSGDEQHELGISKAGPGQMRGLTIEIAWGWLEHQPDSELSRWYWRGFGHGSKRIRKIGIVALARQLLIALWRYLEYGEMPAGARLKA